MLQNLWDAEFRDSSVMIILCGSAMSFIEKELLAEKNPLYGRATGIYKMNEMGFYDAAKFFPNYSDRDKVFAYAVLGGIPHYLRQWNPNLSVGENIKKIGASKRSRNALRRSWRRGCRSCVSPPFPAPVLSSVSNEARAATIPVIGTQTIPRRTVNWPIIITTGSA